MVEKGYYIPKLEEIYFGYEYESLEQDDDFNDIWVKKVFPDEFLHKSSGWLEVNIKRFEDEIRVKYLTKECIISLGFEFKVFGFKDNFRKHLPIGYIYEEITYPFEYWYNKDEFWISIYPSIHKIAIIERLSETNEVLRYSGECKSKNELIKLCTWLKIE